MYNTNIEYQIERYQGTPVHLLNNKSLSKYTLQNSIKNIRKQENKKYLNILITDIEYLELIGECISFCHVGITGISLEQKRILAQFYANRVLIVDETIKNSYIDIIITDKKQLLNNLIHKNYIKYIYSIYYKFPLQYYKAYQSSIPNSYFYINRLGVDAYKQLQFTSQQNNIQKPNIQITKKQIKSEILSIEETKKDQINYLYNNKTVNIIIPYHNNQISTLKTTKSIQRYSANSQYKINLILISDGSKKQITQSILNELKRYKNITYQFVINDKRNGYIKSVNIGIKKALQNQTQYIVLMHNDIQVSYNWKDLLLQINNETVATCPLTNCQYDLQQSIRYIRMNNILQNFPKSFQKCKTLTINQMLSIYKNKNIQLSKDTFIPHFFCIAFNAKIFKQIGLLNESFGQGFGQNIDYVYKIYNNGYKIKFMPSVYIPHVGRTTFKDFHSLRQLNQQINTRQFFNKFSLQLNSLKRKNKVIYSCITNNYDIINHSFYNTDQFDYILFGESNNVPQPWTVINIQPFKKYIKTDDPIKIARFFKTHPHLFFRNYQQSLWIDGNIDIIEDPINIFQLLLDDQFLLISKHPQRNSVYSEAQVCKVMEKDSQENINSIIKFLNQNDFKDNTGLVQSGLLLRNHNNIKCKKLMENWWELILKYSCRDQLSFNYCLQKSNQEVMLVDWNIFNNKYIKWNGKHGNNK